MKRAPNFSPTEVDLLLQIIEPRRHIVESKKTDKMSIDQKERAWEAITSEFNARSEATPLRTIGTLKKKHENLKKVLRKRSSVHIKSVLGADEPSAKLFTYDSNDEKPEFEAECLQKQHSSDCTEPETVFRDEEAETSVSATEHESLEINPLEESISGKANCSPQRTQSPKFQIENAQQQRLCANGVDLSEFSWTNIAKIKTKWAEEKFKTEIDILRKEHEQRMKFMREKHQLEMRILKNELEKSELLPSGGI